MDNKKQNSFSFFSYFKKLIGLHVYFYLFINFLVGLMDALGLSMFIPLLSLSTGSSDSKESLGNLSFILTGIDSLGIKLNLFSALSIMVSFFVIKGILSFFRSIYFTKIKLIVSRKVRFQLLDNLSNVSYEGYTQMDAGRIQNTMINEINRMSTAFTQYFSSIQNLILLISYLLIAFVSNWQFAILVGAGGIISNFIFKRINQITKRKSKDLSLVGHIFNGYLIQTTNNFKYLKATNGINIFNRKLKKIVFDGENINYKLGKISAFSESIREPLIIIIIAIVIIVQINFLGSKMTTILVSLLMFYRALSYLVLVQNQWNSFLSNAAGLDSVENLSKELLEKGEVKSNSTISNVKDITIENLNLFFGSKHVLKNINFHVPDNSSIALIGESGAGKTSLANVICGIQKPSSGNIFINGTSLYQSDLKHFRNKIGYITQEPVIFDDSIYNNVTLWQEKTEENLNKFWKVIQNVSLLEMVNSNPKLEDTPLGNNGILISGGQKQRISIARELFKEMELLIMDEATSALDSETEKSIKDYIDLLNGKFTMIIIAHRLSTIKNVDHIYLMEKGEIINHGNYNELLNSSEKFKKMVELQEL